MEKIVFLFAFVVIGIKALPPSVQRNSWSEFLARREMETEDICSSYSALRSEVRDAINTDISSFFDDTFADSPVQGDTLLEESKELCRSVATKVHQITEERLDSCPSASCLMHIFSGLCTDEGSLTHFFYSVFTGYQSVNLALKAEDRCASSLFPLFQYCPRSMDLNVTIPEGPVVYQRSMMNQTSCLTGVMDEYSSELQACGDLGSLKRMAIIIELFISVGPGAVFTTDDIQVKQK